MRNEKISHCCSARVDSDIGICGECKEHCEAIVVEE